MIISIVTELNLAEITYSLDIIYFVKVHFEPGVYMPLVEVDSAIYGIKGVAYKKLQNHTKR